MYNSPPSTPRGRPRTPSENNWNHSSRQQKSRLDAALTAQWSKDQDQEERSRLSKDGRKTNVDRREREGIISGNPTTSKSQRTNYYEAELQNARDMLRWQQLKSFNCGVIFAIIFYVKFYNVTLLDIAKLSPS